MTLAVVVSLTAGCAGEERARRRSTETRAEDVYGPPRVVGRLQVPELTELSGLAASARNPGKLWAHNDSGGRPIIYCLTPRGRSCGTRHIAGATVVDWEDIAVAPGPRGTALYIADIGDNGRTRDSVTIYRVTEPHIGATSSATLHADAFEVTYPGRAHDAEAVIVERTSGDLYVITKEYARRARVYVARAPLRPTSTMEQVATVDLPGTIPAVTGASLAPGDDRVILSTYGSGYELRLPPRRPFEKIWDEKPVRVALGPHAQGEAVTYTLNGDIVSGSEGARSPLYAVEYLARP